MLEVISKNHNVEYDYKMYKNKKNVPYIYEAFF